MQIRGDVLLQVSFCPSDPPAGFVAGMRQHTPGTRDASENHGQHRTPPQAGLAAQLGVAFGTINWYLKRLIKKGYAKTKQLERRNETAMNNREPLERITVDPDVMVGKPVIVGTRIPVALILKLLGLGMRSDEILDEYPQLEAADIEAAAAYAAAVVEREDVFPTPAGDERVPV